MMKKKINYLIWEHMLIREYMVSCGNQMSEINKFWIIYNLIFILTFDFELQLHKWIYLCISISCTFRPKLCFIDISIFRSKIKNKVNYNLILMFYSIRLQKEFQISSQKLCLILDRVLVQPFGHQKPFGQNQLTNFSVWIYHHRWMNCHNSY